MEVVYKIHPITDYQEWAQHFLSVKKSHLSQSWFYGDAKFKSHGWKLMRGAIVENDRPIALIQVWYKTFLFLKLARLSYGPLWIVEQPTLNQTQGAFRAIKQAWCLKTLCVLSLAPNLDNIPDYQSLLASLGFYRRKSNAYESGWVDLKQPVPVLRSKLRQNWRNQLNASEKKELIFSVSRDEADFKWIIACFEQFRKEKNFYGHSVALLKALYHASFDVHTIRVAIVSHGTERVAGMIMACYGTTSVPLTIWTNQNGRSLNAGNFLLWNSVLYAKNEGIELFDLGWI